MPLTDAELVKALLDACEGLWVQNIQLRGLLRRSGLGDWKSKLDSEESSVAASLARAAFRRNYAQAVQQEQALRAWLESLPTGDHVQ